VYGGTDVGDVWISIDGGGTWTDVSAGLPERWVTRVLVDPTDASIGYVTFSGLKWQDSEAHVFRTASYGTTWSDISVGLPDAPVNAMAIDPLDPELLFVGTDVGVFMSEDAGATWTAHTLGMPVVSVYDLDIHERSRSLFAATHGRSIFESRLSSPPVRSEAERPVSVIASLDVWPNPTMGPLTIGVRSTSEDAVDVTVYDIRGRRLMHRVLGGDGVVTQRTVTWDGTDASGRPVSSGTYVVQAGGSGGALTVQTLVTVTR